MVSTVRRRIAWMLATMLWASCGASAEKVEAPRAPAEDKEPADPDEFVITDEPDRDLAADDEPAPAEKPAPDQEDKADKAEKKVVDPEPERVATAEEDENEATDAEERPAKRVRINRSTVGVGRAEREARMARDEQARASKGRRGKGARDEEDDEDREAREEEARAAKEARAEKAREAKEARAEKALAAKEARDEKARKAKEAREAKTRAAAEAKKAREAKARDAKNASDDEEAASDDTADEEAEEEETKPAPKAVKASAKKVAAVDPDAIEMEEEEEEEEEPPSGRVASIDEDTGDPLGENAVDTVAPAAPVVGPLAINNRSLTVAPKKLEIHGGLRLLTLTVPGMAAGTTVSSTSEALSLGLAYGLGQKAEVGADYTLSLNPGTVKGPLALHVAYSAKRGAKLDVAIAAGLAFDFDQTPNAVTMMTTTTSYASLQLGAWARYRVTPKVSLFTGLPALPSASPSLSKATLALPPFAYQVAIGLNNAGTTAVDVPIGLGVQVKSNIYAFATLDFAHIRIANTPSAYLFADFIPFALGAFYSRDKLDIGLQLADDLKRGADYLRVETVLRYSVK
jgi:hypothetical protein